MIRELPPVFKKPVGYDYTGHNKYDSQVPINEWEEQEEPEEQILKKQKVEKEIK